MKITRKTDYSIKCVLNMSEDIGEVFGVRSNSFQEFREAFFIHGSRQRESDIGIHACSRKKFFGNIDTDKEFTQGSTSVKSYLDKAGEASRPILHDDKDSMIQSTYHGYGRQGTDSFKGSMTQGKWSSPACPTLTGKTRLYRFYNTNF